MMKRLTCILLSTVAMSSLAKAEQNNYPTISGELGFELQDDWTYDSDDEANEFNDLYPTVTLGTSVGFTDEFSVNLEAILEPVEDATKDRAFSDLGGYIEVLTADYETDQYHIYGGKFSPNFGIAFDATPGLYSDDFNDDYKLAEMIGFGGAVNFDAAGTHSISASTFFSDTTFLSDSAGTSRGPLEKEDGGAANTEDFSSFALALDGSFEKLEGFRYHIGFSSLGEGEDGTKSQKGYVISGEYEIPVNEDVTVTPLLEYTSLSDLGGADNDEADYLTAGIGMGVSNWSASLTYQNRDKETSGQSVDDYVTAATVGYAFDFGLETAIAYRVSEEDSVDNKGLGFFAGYAIEF